MADPRVLALALVQSTAGYELDEPELDRRLRLAADLAHTVDDPDLILSVTSAQMTAALMWARRDEFDGALARYTEVATRTSSPVHLALSAVDTAGAAALDGHYAEAIVLSEAAARQVERFGDLNLMASVLNGMNVAQRELGRYVEHREDVDRRLPDGSWPVLGRVVTRIRILAERGDRDGAASLLESVLDQPDRLRIGFVRRFRLALLAEATEMIGHRDAASSLTSWLAAELRFGECIVVGANAFYGSARRYLGLLAMTLGERDDAVEHHRRGTRHPPADARRRLGRAQSLRPRPCAGGERPAGRCRTSPGVGSCGAPVGRRARHDGAPRRARRGQRVTGPWPRGSARRHGAVMDVFTNDEGAGRSIDEVAAA